MPRDRRPEFKSQIRIKGRVFEIPNGMSKDVFKFFRWLDRDLITKGIALPQGEEMTRFIITNPHYYDEYKRIKSKEVRNN